jgi:hypothetical protein
VNPEVPADYHEVARWLEGFARAHAKREAPRIEASVDATGPREGRSYGLRLALAGRTVPPSGEPPLELGFDEVAAGRTRFAWCDELAERIRTAARRLAAPGVRSA